MKLIKKCIFLLFLLNIITLNSCSTSPLPPLEDTNNTDIGVGYIPLNYTSFNNLKDKVLAENGTYKKSSDLTILSNKDTKLYLSPEVYLTKSILITCPIEYFNKDNNTLMDIFIFLSDDNEALGKKLFNLIESKYTQGPFDSYNIFSELSVSYKVINGIVNLNFFNLLETTSLNINDKNGNFTLQLPRSFSDKITYKIHHFSDDFCETESITFYYTPRKDLSIEIASLDKVDMKYKNYIFEKYDGYTIKTDGDFFYYFYMVEDFNNAFKNSSVKLTTEERNYFNKIILPDLNKFEFYIK